MMSSIVMEITYGQMGHLIKVFGETGNWRDGLSNFRKQIDLCQLQL